MKKFFFGLFLGIIILFFVGNFILREINKYDVIVVGGEPEGVAAAVSAARNGMKVLLVEKSSSLGGIMTNAKLNFIDMNYSSDRTLLTQGIFQEFFKKVGGSAFEIDKAKDHFLSMIKKEENIELKLNAEFIAPIMSGNKIKGVKISEVNKTKKYYARRVIDATIDADVAAMSGVPYTFGGEDYQEKDRLMGVTLVFELSGVDWDRVSKYLNNDNNMNTGAIYKTAWGYMEEGYGYVPQDKEMRLRGFNIARQKNGNVLINSLIIFGVNVLSIESKNEGIVRGKSELENIIPYVRENFIGFENAKLVGTAEDLYIRESRHIKGEYQLTIDDVLENRDQWDRIALGSYPVDIQPSLTNRNVIIVGNPEKYSIPFRSLVPLKVENLLVVGRSASFTSLAAGSARVIPVGMCTGQAAGVATALSINEKISFRDISKSLDAVHNIQATLIEQGAYLEPFTIDNPISKHWAYKGVKTLRRIGLFEGGYRNNYNLDKPVDKLFFEQALTGIMKKSGFTDLEINVSEKPTSKEILDSVNKGLINLGKDVTVRNSEILDTSLYPYFKDENRKPQKAEVIMLLANMYDHVNK